MIWSTWWGYCWLHSGRNLSASCFLATPNYPGDSLIGFPVEFSGKYQHAKTCLKYNCHHDDHYSWILSSHSLCFNSEIMEGSCHSMTFTLASLTMAIKITSVLKSEGCRPLGSCQLPFHSLPTAFVLVCFYYPATALDPHASLFLFSPSRADTLTLTSSVLSDLLSPVVCSAINAPGFDARCRNNKSFSRFGSSSRLFIS